jgi:hypothetical protein
MKNLMLAQAQVCFYEKALKERKNGSMKPAIVAKLAQQAGVFYGYAIEPLRDVAMQAIIDNSWIYHMEFQRDSFRSVAEYWQAVSAKEDALNR